MIGLWHGISFLQNFPSAIGRWLGVGRLRAKWAGNPICGLVVAPLYHLSRRQVNIVDSICCHYKQNYASINPCYLLSVSINVF